MIDPELFRIFRGGIDGAPQWIVEFHTDYDETEWTPLTVAQQAYKDIASGHCCTVIHVATDLEWSVDLKLREVIEIDTVRSKQLDLPGVFPWR